MKKRTKIIVCIIAASLCIGMGTLISSADFGIGVQVMAEDAKLIKTGLAGKRMVFSELDFKSAMNIADFESITITEVPSSTDGTLTYGGRRVIAGRVVKRKNIGLLSFIPASTSVSEARFTFTLEPSSSGAKVECIMKFVDKVNYAPKTDDTSVAHTQSEIEYFGRLEAHDPEGDALEFMVVTYPKNGELTLDKDGKYSYMPRGEFVGKDKFTFVVRDSFGNFSEPMSVSIKVSERMCDTVFVDMIGRSEYNGAVAMAAMGIMNGKILGNDIYFEADKTVTRAEFIAMAMRALGIKVDTTLTKSFFDDDGDIPKSLQGYVATAARLGAARGDFVDGKLMFYPNEEITNYEVAEIITCLAGISGGEEKGEFEDSEGVPVWARESVSMMFTLGVFDVEDTAPDAMATRAAVADYLYKMMLVMN